LQNFILVVVYVVVVSVVSVVVVVPRFYVVVQGPAARHRAAVS